MIFERGFIILKKYNEEKVLTFTDFKILAILVLFIVVLMSFCALAVQKTITIFGFTLPYISIWFSIISFPVMQIIGNIYSKRFANFAILVGWLSILLTTIIAQISTTIPPTPAFSANNEAFNSLMSSSFRFLLSGAFSFAIAHFFGNELFHRANFVKQLWLKSIIITLAAQILNTIIFIFAMYTGLMPWENTVSLFIGTMVMKLCVLPIDMLLVCGGCFILKKIKEPKNQENQKVSKITDTNQKVSSMRNIVASFFL